MQSDFGRKQLRIYVGEARCPRRRFESEREEETRDRAERGSEVRGSDQASVAAEEDPLRRTGDLTKALATQNQLAAGTSLA